MYLTLHTPGECRDLLQQQTSSTIIPGVRKPFSGSVEHNRFVLRLVSALAVATTEPNYAFGQLSRQGEFTQITVRVAPATATLMPFIGFSMTGVFCAIATLLPAAFGRPIFDDLFDFVLIAILPAVLFLTWFLAFTDDHSKSDRALFDQIARTLDAALVTHPYAGLPVIKSLET